MPRGNGFQTFCRNYFLEPRTKPAWRAIEMTRYRDGTLLKERKGALRNFMARFLQDRVLDITFVISFRLWQDRLYLH